MAQSALTWAWQPNNVLPFAFHGEDNLRRSGTVSEVEQVEQPARARASEPSAYLAVIGDVVRSRDLPDRAAVQRTLREQLRALNDGPAGESMVAPLELTAGDEVQGLLRDPAAAVDIVARLADHLHPVTLVWGFGHGLLATDIYPEVTAMDGPCFHRARGALEEAAREGAWVGVQGFPAPHADVLSALFRLSQGIRSRWTDTQARYVRAARTRLQKDVARRFGVDDSTVSESLSKAHYKTVLAGERAARELLGWLADTETGADSAERTVPSEERR